MRVWRLFAMDRSELDERGRQAVRSLLERVGARRPCSWSGRLPEPARFFAGLSDDSAVSLLTARCPLAVEAIDRAAQRIVEGRFDLLGYEALDFGVPIAWHRDPTAQTRAARTGSGQRADRKIVWELNRHGWLLHLAQATRLGGDPRFARRGIELLRAWLAANPTGRGINWASSLEVALRLVAWSWFTMLLLPTGLLEPSFLIQLSRGMVRHAHHIEQHLSLYTSPNTHLTGEALGLLYAGVLLDEPRWVQRARDILLAESSRQILEDGVHFEQSTCYQRYSADIYLQALLLAEQSGMPLPQSVWDRLCAMLDVLITLRRPDGTLPAIGDDDGGQILPLDPRHNQTGFFAPAAARLGRGDYAWATGGVTPELVWMLGSDGVAAFDALAALPPHRSASSVLHHGGYVIMRNDWSGKAHQLTLDVGPLGALCGGYGYADLLSVQCNAFGEPFLIDAGTCCYTVDPHTRDALRGTASHNTVCVDGRDQALADGPFGWQKLPRAHLHRWRQQPGILDADAFHDGYGPALRHRRRALFVDQRVWLLIDDVTGNGEHHLDLRFVFDPRLQVVVSDDLYTRARGSHGLLIRSASRVPLCRRLHRAQVDPFGGWVSPAYGLLVETTTLSVSCRARLPVRIATLLWPLSDGGAKSPELLFEVGTIGEPVCLRTTDPALGLVVEEDGAHLSRG